MTDQFTLFTREGCHLCEDLMQDLRTFDEFKSLEVELVDIDNDPALQQKYNTDVPVLAMGSEIICKHFLNPMALREAIARG